MILSLLILAINPPLTDFTNVRLIEEDVPAAGAEVAGSDDKPKPKKRLIRKHKHKVLSAKPVPSMDPSGGPRPYITLTQSEGPVAHVDTPAPPPPPLVTVVRSPEPAVPEVEPRGSSEAAGLDGEVHLRCETRTLVDHKGGTRGVFHLSLIRSELNPDAFADLIVMSIDAAHQSVMRDTDCFSVRCSVNVTPTFYELSTAYKRRDQMKISLNRQTGAYFAHEVRAEVPFDHVQVLSGISTNTIVLDEAGFCTPETPQRPRF